MSAKSKATTPWARVCYGIEVHDDTVRMVHAERGGRRIRWAAMPFDADALAAAVTAGAAVASVLPVGTGIATRVTAPFASATKAERVYATLLDIQLPFPLEDCVYSFSESRRTLEGVDALAMAARTVDVERRLEMLAGVGVDPHVLDYEGAALWTQGLREHPVDVAGTPPGLRVIIHMYGVAGVMVMGCGNVFWSAHRVWASDAAAVDRYLRAQLKQHNFKISLGDSPVVQWFWSGPGMLSPAPEVATLRATVEDHWPGPSVTVEDPEVFLARALAIRALTDGALRANLRRGALAHPGAQARAHGVRTRSASVLLAAGVVLASASLTWEASVRARRDALKVQFATRVKALLGYTEKARGRNALLIVERELAARTARRQPLLNAFKPSLLEELQHVVADLGEGQLKISHFVLNAKHLELKGAASSRAYGKVLRKMLAAKGYQVDVAWDDSGVNDTFPFALTADKGGAHE